MDSINFISYIKVYLFINKGYTNAYLIPFYTLLLSRLGKKPVTETAFYLSRKKFNPQAICVMSNEFIANYHDNEADS